MLKIYFNFYLYVGILVRNSTIPTASSGIGY